MRAVTRAPDAVVRRVEGGVPNVQARGRPHRRPPVRAAQRGRARADATQQLSLLLEIAASSRLTRAHVGRLAGVLAQAVDAPALTIRLLDPTRRWLELHASVGLSKALRARIRRVPLASPVGKAIARRARRVTISADAHPPGTASWPPGVVRRFRAGAFAPIRAGRTILGVLGVAYHEEGHPTDAQMRLLETLGLQVGTALQMVRERETRGKAHSESRTLRKIIEALSSHLDPTAVIDMVTAAAARLTRATGAIVMLKGPDREEFEVASQSDTGGRANLVGLRFPIAGSLAGRVLRSGRSFRSRDARTDRRPMLRPLVEMAQVRGLLIVPLRTREGPIGTLNVSARRPRLFSDRDRRVLQRLAQHASLALQNARLFEAEQRHRKLLRELYSQQFATLEGERKRIAHELHDELGPSLSATLLNLEIIHRLGEADTALGAKVDETERLLRGMVEKVRELSYGLRPPMLEHLGLAESLRWMIDNYFNTGKLMVRYRSSGSDGAVEPELALAIYRIAQEALTNVVRHAEASRADVGLRIGRRSLTLRVLDNGRGFDPTTRPGGRSGLGLAGMRERMEQLHGRIDVESAPGSGCGLTVSCPIEVERARTAG